MKNATGQPVSLLPWSRIRRDYKPETAGYYILLEGMLGVVDGSLKETTYDKAKSEGEKKGGIAFDGDRHRRVGRHHRQILADRDDPGSGAAVARSISATSTTMATTTRSTTSATDPMTAPANGDVASDQPCVRRRQGGAPARPL